MARDPRYAPPATEVADPPLVPALPSRPRQVQIAVALLWLSLALGIPEAILSTRQVEGDGMGAAFAVVMLLVFGLVGFLTLKVYQGRNWARIAMLVLTVLSVIMMLFPSDESRAEGPMLQGLYLFDVLIEVVAMYLVFSKPGSLWFKRPA
jgi:hypothetical protein